MTLAKVRYTHDAMIDLMIADPSVSQNDLAAQFGFTPPWVSIVVNSDAFQLRLQARKAELVDPVLTASIEDRLRAVTQVALDRILEMGATKSMTTEEAIKAVTVTSRALGYGVRQPDNKVAVTQYVAFLPPQAASADEWAANNKPIPQDVLEMEVAKVSGEDATR